jgi:sulfatase maturation enzyme AslB (radical SAM superfamily)
MLKDTFCSSPWFHIRLTYNGDFIPCRWSAQTKTKHNLRNTNILQFYNSEQMRSLRTKLLNGEQPTECSTCYYEDSFNKLNGRQRQLLKSAINVNDFDRTIRSSPHYNLFVESNNNQGQSSYHPVDLQIDLGNLCNSSCIMCYPVASSRLTADYQKLNLVDSRLFPKPNNFTSWTRDPEMVNQFVNELSTFPSIRYIHFLGGETLYDESFYTICERLIEAGLSKNIIVGTTTNGTIYNQRLERIINEFAEFHLGISIESVTKLNDYIRYPSSIGEVLGNIDKFLALRNQASQLKLQLRITPNIFSISEIDQVFRYMIEKNITAESCNILQDPPHLKMELMPWDIRDTIQSKLKELIKEYDLTKSGIKNVRRSDLISKSIADLIVDYSTFIETYTVPDDCEELRKDLVQFLKAFESIRGNSILDYAPDYEKFLRSYGY